MYIKWSVDKVFLADVLKLSAFSKKWVSHIIWNYNECLLQKGLGFSQKEFRNTSFLYQETSWVFVSNGLIRLPQVIGKCFYVKQSNEIWQMLKCLPVSIMLG